MTKLPQLGWSTLHLTLLNFMKFTQAHLSSLSRSLWMESLPSSVLTAPHSLVSLADWLREHLIHCPCSAKELNSISTSTDSEKHLSLAFTWTSSHCPQLSECDHPANSLSTECSICQICVFPETRTVLQALHRFR